MVRVGVGVSLAGLSAGCASVAAPPPPVPEPVVVVEDVADEPGLPPVELMAPATEAVPDPLRSSPMIRHEDFLAEVERWTTRLDGGNAPWFASDLARMARWSERVDSMIAERGLPRSLRYLPVIESGYDPTAVSRARAVGMWQLMPATARGLGVRVSPLVDDRRDPLRSTEAALVFLEQLHRDFGSWFLALAAYNSGPGRVRGVLRRHAPLAPASDSLYWAIRPHLPRETRDFVPKLFATILIGERPHAFGHPRTDEAGLAWDEVEVPDATTTDVIARAAGVDQALVEELNPQLLRGMTPPGAAARVRLPAGTADAFREAYARIPAEERVTFVEHRVAAGETLSHIAVRYGVRVADLQAANPAVRARLLRVGTLLTVPLVPRAGR